MAELLKNLYSPRFYDRFADVLDQNVPVFDREAFLAQIFVPEWDSMELKQRMWHTSATLGTVLPADFREAAETIRQIIESLRAAPFTASSFEFLFLADYVERFGLDDFEGSVQAMEDITQYVSCEFAVRPFLVRYGEQMFAQMRQWAGHPSSRVRRLASEGMRPRLPWAMAVPALKRDPAPILPVLEALKADPSESVRRSVANNLNDISKDWPDVAFSTASRWMGTSPEVDAVVKHGCRTLLKKGHDGALRLFGHHADERVHTSGLVVHTPEVPMGASLRFSFQVTNTGDEPVAVRLEYGMDFLRQNGTWSRKVFKISERELAAGETAAIDRRQSFRPITTRRYYAGPHRVAVIVNGQEEAVGEFLLLGD